MKFNEYHFIQSMFSNIYADYNNDKNETKTEEIYIQQIDKQIPLISIHLLC